MGEKRYIVLQPDEGGNPVRWLKREEVNDIQQIMEDYSIARFLEEVPRISDTNYWDEGDAMLLEVTIKKVVPVKVVETYEIR